MNIQLDKQAHFWAGLGIFGLAVVLASPLLSLGVVALAAVGKELWDSRTHPADWIDAAYTLAGGALALLWTLGVWMLRL